MRQAIVIIGGYNSLWPLYLNMARRLEDISGLPAVGVPLMPWDWWLAVRTADATNILHKLKETVNWARRKFQADRFILVGHSAGGLIARLYLCDRPVWSQVYAGVEHVAAVITLGSPHCCDRTPSGQDAPGSLAAPVSGASPPASLAAPVSGASPPGSLAAPVSGASAPATNWFLVDTANRLVPGSFYADRLRYRAVVGRHIQGRRPGTFKEMRAFRMYRLLGGEGHVWGDGIVPVRCQRLDGAETLTLAGVSHSIKIGRDWYGGSKDIIRRWWPDRLGHGD